VSFASANTPRNRNPFYSMLYISNIMLEITNEWGDKKEGNTKR
jgi:hypothetical protein